MNSLNSSNPFIDFRLTASVVRFAEWIDLPQTADECARIFAGELIMTGEHSFQNFWIIELPEFQIMTGPQTSKSSTGLLGRQIGISV